MPEMSENIRQILQNFLLIFAIIWLVISKTILLLLKYTRQF